MTDVKDFFSGNFLKAEDCKGGEIVEIMGEGEVSEIQQANGKVKTVLNYAVLIDGKEKEWTPNMTNGNILIDAWGQNDTAWIGKKFKIVLAKSLVFGKLKNSIVVEPIVEEKAKVK